MGNISLRFYFVYSWWQNIEHLFVSLGAILKTLYKTMLNVFLNSFFFLIKLLVFLLLSYITYICRMPIFCQIHIFRIFSHCMPCLFTFFILLFSEQRLFTFDKFNFVFFLIFPLRILQRWAPMISSRIIKLSLCHSFMLHSKLNLWIVWGKSTCSSTIC